MARSECAGVALVWTLEVSGASRSYESASESCYIQHDQAESLARARLKDTMKRTKSLLAACILVVLAGCGASAAEPAEPPATPSPLEAAKAEAAELTAEWDPLDPSEAELPGTATQHFSAAQVDSVAADAWALLQNYQEHTQAAGGDEAAAAADEFISSAPGMLADYMREDLASRASDDDAWLLQLLYAHPIDSRYTIEDGSRTTVAWDVSEVSMHDTVGVEVTLFHRTYYDLTSPDGDEGFVTLGRWITLATIDPEYASESGDYAWYLNFFTGGAEPCSAVARQVLEPSDDFDEERSLELMSIGAGEFAPKSEFESDKTELNDYVAECSEDDTAAA